MKRTFYPRLAMDGIRKNKRLYFPYLLTCAGMVMMAYIMNYLHCAEAISYLPGSAIIRSYMAIGIFVITFFSALFLFYTNSFLMKRRKKEFGLYNILGMGKGSLSRLLLWETLFLAVAALFLGLLFGIAFSKLTELGFSRVLGGVTTYDFTVPTQATLGTVLPFLAIFALLYCNSLRQIWFSSAITLLRSENAGEKPPKANWLLGLLGVVTLGIAYYIAVSMSNPISAIGAFFVAVILVIIATYLLLISGSVVFCRILQKRKRYYYQPNHFVSVASMVYRMKRNGAGLASICILATMVLVMISSTSALCIGAEDVLHARYPREISTWFRMHDNQAIPQEDTDLFLQTFEEVLNRHNAQAQNLIRYHSISTAGLLQDNGEILYDQSAFGEFDIDTFSDVHQIYIVPLADYNTMMGTQEVLAPDEALVYASRTAFHADTISFVGQKPYRVKEILKEAFLSPDMAMDIVPSLMVIVQDVAAATEGLFSVDGKDLTYQKWYYCFDTDLSPEENIALHEELKEAFRELQINGHDTFLSIIESRDNERRDFYALYGGLLYLGLMLSVVFLFAATLIIYYKQISEGYEDQARFDIMQKVGMTKQDIRKSINSQILTVFFLPLLLAGLHLAFAFPIVEKLLYLFNMHNTPLFLATSLGSFLIFALFYAIVYRITSNAYYQIVSGGQEARAV